jgi:hypothetical protein
MTRRLPVKHNFDVGEQLNRTETTRTARRGDAADRDAVVRALSRLTHELEAFDSMLEHQRRILERDVVALRPPEPGQISRRSKRIRAAAAKLVSRAHGAMEELGGTGRGELQPADTLRGVRVPRSQRAR